MTLTAPLSRALFYIHWGKVSETFSLKVFKGEDFVENLTSWSENSNFQASKSTISEQDTKQDKQTFT